MSTYQALKHWKKNLKPFINKLLITQQQCSKVPLLFCHPYPLRYQIRVEAPVVRCCNCKNSRTQSWQIVFVTNTSAFFNAGLGGWQDTVTLLNQPPNCPRCGDRVSEVAPLSPEPGVTNLPNIWRERDKVVHTKTEPPASPRARAEVFYHPAESRQLPPAPLPKPWLWERVLKCHNPSEQASTLSEMPGSVCSTLHLGCIK